jgi:hypothetical protein
MELDARIPGKSGFLELRPEPALDYLLRHCPQRHAILFRLDLAFLYKDFTIKMSKKNANIMKGVRL